MRICAISFVVDQKTQIQELGVNWGIMFRKNGFLTRLNIIQKQKKRH